MDWNYTVSITTYMPSGVYDLAASLGDLHPPKSKRLLPPYTLPILLV